MLLRLDFPLKGRMPIFPADLDPFGFVSVKDSGRTPATVSF